MPDQDIIPTTKEELFEKICFEFPNSEIPDDIPLPLMYRIYRIYKELSEYSGAYIIPDYPSIIPDKTASNPELPELQASKIAMEFRLVADSDDELDYNEWAHVIVYNDGSWATDGHFVNRPLDLCAPVDESAETEAMAIFVRDLPPLP